MQFARKSSYYIANVTSVHKGNEQKSRMGLLNNWAGKAIVQEQSLDDIDTTGNPSLVLGRRFIYSNKFKGYANFWR